MSNTSDSDDVLRAHHLPPAEPPRLPLFTARELEEIHRKLGMIMTKAAQLRDNTELHHDVRTAARMMSREARQLTAILQDRLRLMVVGGAPTPIELIILDLERMEAAEEPVRV